MNIVLIIIDTLRYDYVGANGNPNISTPNLDRLAAESWVFDRAFSASFPTIPFRNDVMRGQYGGPFHPWKPLPFNAPAFPRILGDNGYATQLIHDTPHLVNGGHNFDWPFHGWTFIRGAEVDRPWITDGFKLPDNWAFDPMFDCLELPERESWVPDHPSLATYVRANRDRKTLDDWNCARLFDTASTFLADNVERDSFFLWLDCFDPHEPWDAPEAYVRLYDDTPGYDGTIDPRSFQANRNDKRLSDAARSRIRAQYCAKVSWMDRCLGRLLDALDETGLAGNTAVVLVGDHGTNDGSTGFFGKRAPVTEAEAHVPLMIRTPDGGAGRTDVIWQPQDMFATILGLAGVSPDGDGPRAAESFDVLTAAREGAAGEREIALTGGAVNSWRGRGAEDTLFTAFDREWCLQVAPSVEHSRLMRLGEVDDVAAQNAEVVKRLHAAALAAIRRRGLDPALADWLEEGGTGEFPAEASFWDGWPDDSGHYAYFGRLYQED